MTFEAKHSGGRTFPTYLKREQRKCGSVNGKETTRLKCDGASPLAVCQDGYGGADLVKRRIHLEWALRRPLITGDKLIAAAERRLREGPSASVLRIWRLLLLRAWDFRAFPGFGF